MTHNQKHVLIVGAKSDIAKAVARRFAEQNYSLQLAARDIQSLAGYEEDLKIRGASKVTCFNLDIEMNESIEHFMKNLDPLPDLAVCAVGYQGVQKQTQNSPQEMYRIIKSNLTGPAMLFEKLTALMEQRGSGMLVGISSVAGDRGKASNYWLGCAKSGFTTFLSGLRQRLNGSKVHILTVKPGFVRTAMTADLDLPPSLTSTPDKIADDIMKAISKNKNVLYTPFYWFFILKIICEIPEFIYKKLRM